MTYRAPVADIAFTMRHVAGLDRAVEEGLYGDLGPDLAATILEEAGRFANDVIAPLNRTGDAHGTPFKDGAVTMPPGFQEAYKAWTEAGWNALPGPEDWRTRPAGAAQFRLRRDVERGLPRLRARAAPHHGRHRGARRARLRDPEGPLSGEGGVGPMDRHHEPHGAAGGLRLGGDPHPRRAGRRRRLPHHGARSSSPTASTTSRTTSSISSSPDFPTRRPARAASRSFSFRRCCRTGRATTSAATASSTSSASMPRPPAR